MKRILILLGAASIILTSCGTTTSDTTKNIESEITSSNTDTTKGIAEKLYAANGVELNIDMSQYSDKAKLLTADDIYILSYNCGYISGNHPVMMIIENQEQLDFAFERYGLSLPPEGLSKDELWDYGSTAISDSFNEMIAEYPINDYSYVIEYDEVSCGGYDLRVGALLVDQDKLHFVRTADSKTPEPESVQPDVMGGFCYMAAVPKGTLMNEHYESWTYPDKNDLYQDIDFCYQVDYDISDTTELYQIYGDAGYIVRNEEELQTLVNMAGSVTNRSNQPAFTFQLNVDYNKAALLFRFFISDNEKIAHSSSQVRIENNTVHMDYNSSDGSCTGLAYAVIPLRFLPDELSSDWKSPDGTVNSSDDAPKIDMSMYSKNAKLYTADEIMLYANSIGNLGFEGKYTIFSDDNSRQEYIAWDNYGFGEDNGFVKLVEHNIGDENVYFVQYISGLEENSDMQLLGLVIDGNKAEFVYYDRNSKREYQSANGNGGIGFYAAVPVEDIKSDCFEGWEIPKDGNEGDTIEDGYIAVFRSGMDVNAIGEETYETYVYKKEKGYHYVNVTSTMMDYPFWWKHEITSSGEVSSKEEILEQAKQNAAANIVTLPGDDNTMYFVDSFMTLDW